MDGSGAKGRFLLGAGLLLAGLLGLSIKSIYRTHTENEFIQEYTPSPRGCCSHWGMCPLSSVKSSPASMGPKPPVEQTITSEEQRQVAENRKRLEQEEANRRLGESGQYNQLPSGGPTTPKANYPTAAAVPGKPGFVFNPYTQNIVDVKGIASGRLCRDPEDANPSHKFRVP